MGGDILTGIVLTKFFYFVSLGGMTALVYVFGASAPLTVALNRASGSINSGYPLIQSLSTSFIPVSNQIANFAPDPRITEFLLRRIIPTLNNPVRLFLGSMFMSILAAPYLSFRSRFLFNTLENFMPNRFYNKAFCEIIRYFKFLF